MRPELICFGFLIMDDFELDFTAVTDFQQALGKSPEAFIPYAVDAITESTRLIQGALAEYPPSTEANQPGRFSLITGRPMGYYERGAGWWYPIMTKKTLENAASGKYGKARGVVNASALIRAISEVKGYKLIRSSEQLGKSWTTDVQTVEDGVIGVVGTKVSYAPFVQGDEQSSILAKYGWDAHQLDVVMEDLMSTLEDVWSGAADNFIKELAK